MRTTIILAAGLLLFAAIAMFSRLFTSYFPAATTWGVTAFLAVWLLATGFNLWVGVSRGGYSFGEELAIMLLLYTVPAVIAIIVRWKLL